MEVRLSAAAAAWVERLAAALRSRGESLATAESCTGGLLAAACTSLAGSSEWFERGFVTYSNAAKSAMLGVPVELIATRGAVSEEVACAMADGALRHSNAAFAVAVTGIAGPGGGTPQKPVGTVWIATASIDAKAQASLLCASGDRGAIRDAAVVRALALAVARCEASRS